MYEEYLEYDSMAKEIREAMNILNEHTNNQKNKISEFYSATPQVLEKTDSIRQNMQILKSADAIQKTTKVENRGEINQVKNTKPLKSVRYI